MLVVSRTGILWIYFFMYSFIFSLLLLLFCIAPRGIVVHKSGSDVAMLAEQSTACTTHDASSLAMQTQVVLAIYPLWLMPNFECFASSASF